MGLGDFQHGLVATLLEDSGARVDPALERDVQSFVADGVRSMPTHLRLGVESVALLLRVDSLARNGKPFARLGPAARRAAVRTWDASRIDPVRQYIRLVRSLVLFAAYERPIGATVP